MQKRERIVADQRFDLPQYDQMMDLIEREFNAYNKAFFAGSNLIVKNWKVEASGGLQVRVNTAADSLLMNSERTGKEGINYRPALSTPLTITLEDNATNYVEVEIDTTTTGDDSIARWDATANSGQGSEFIQNSDTVYCEEPRLVSNTISYSVSQPSRIKLARVVTASGTVVSTIDDRDFFYHLAADWSFDGSAFGATRTDKSIGSAKQAYDAITTCIKEMKGTSNWVDSQGITTQNLLERMNYMLVDGGTIHWDLTRAATGSLVAVASDPNTSIKDGDLLSLPDGVTTVVFEFDSNGAVAGGHVPITIPVNGTSTQVQAAIIAAVNGNAFNLTASAGVGYRIELADDLTGAGGNVAITQTLSNSASLSPLGMSGGITTPALSWTAPLRIVAPGRAYDYQVAAQTITSVADGEVCYVTLPAEGATPSNPLAVSKCASSAYVVSTGATRRYILAYRSGSKIYFGNGWHSVELESGESNQLGDGPSSELLTALGFPSEMTSRPPYSSNFWVTPGASLTAGVSELDAVVEATWTMVTGKVYEEHVSSDGSSAYLANAYLTLPAPFGVGAAETYQTGYNQLEVFFNGAKADIGDDWFESANVGAGIGNRIQLAYTLPANTKITYRIQTGGGQSGTVGSNSPDIYDEGVLVLGGVGQINFIGGAVTATPNGPSGVDVTFKAVREMGKLYKNATGVTIASGKVVAFLDDGTVALADADNNTLFDIAGITSQTIAHNSYGLVLKLGSCPSVLSALTPVPGAAVYLSTTPGEMTLTAPADPLTASIIRLGRAEPPDGVATTAANDLWLQPEVISEPA